MLTILLLVTPCFVHSGCASAQRPAQEAAPAVTPSPRLAPVQGSAETVWVGRPDGSLSCEAKSGQSLEKGAEELKKSGIQVAESKKGHDGKLRAQVCGIPTGALNLYRIAGPDLAKAGALGFKPQSAASGAQAQ